MKKILSAMMVGLLLMGCSVDNDEISKNEDQLYVANSVFEVDGCKSLEYVISNKSNLDLGEVTVTNDKDNLYLNFTANDGFLISEISWEAVSNEEDLPINNGGIIVGQLDNKERFKSGSSYFGKTIPLDAISAENLSSVVVVAKLNFINSTNEKFSAWIGKDFEFKNGSNYLLYDICIPTSDPVCIANAGDDNSVSLTYRQVLGLGFNNDEDIKNFYLSLLDEGVDRTGTFSPTIKELRLNFYASEANRYADHSTVYTVQNEVNGEICTDSAELTLTITR